MFNCRVFHVMKPIEPQQVWHEMGHWRQPPHPAAHMLATVIDRRKSQWSSG